VVNVVTADDTDCVSSSRSPELEEMDCPIGGQSSADWRMCALESETGGQVAAQVGQVNGMESLEVLLGS